MPTTLQIKLCDGEPHVVASGSLVALSMGAVT